jgi:hypothetical protein
VLLPDVSAFRSSIGSVVIYELWDDELVTIVLLEFSVLEAFDRVLETGIPDDELDNVGKVGLDNFKVEDIVESDTVLVMTIPLDTCEVFDRVLKFKVMGGGMDDIDKTVPDIFKV